MQKYLVTTEDIEAEESLKIINPVLKRISETNMRLTLCLDKAIEVCLESRRASCLKRMVHTIQLAKLESEEEKLQIELYEAERALLSIEGLYEHIDRIAKVYRETANGIIRVINTIKHKHMNRRV
ncbi:MAG: hypothetical protein ACLSH8_03155 [Zhenhengia sp.]|uniref:hypothetical protein n=1 Tax=Zhenhengia sp. TaxID=2944208 RepID=UPI00399227E4